MDIAAYMKDIRFRKGKFMDRRSALRRTLARIVLCALLPVLATAQAIIEEGHEAQTNKRQPPDKILAAIGVERGMVIGEVGAGYGRYTVHLASKVGLSGKVYAEDIDRKSVDHLRDRCRRAGFSNVEAVLGDVSDPHFPKGEIDLVFMILTYHHLADPVGLLKSLVPSLKPGATVAVVDPEYSKDPGSISSEYTSEEKISREAASAGFELVRIETFLPKDNIYILRAKGSSAGQAIRDPFPVLTGPFLGQAAPGVKAELFAPGVVSTGMTEREVAVSPDGREIFFEQSGGRVVTIMSTRLINGRWTEPVVAPFASDMTFYYFEPALSPDGKTVFFLSTLPRAGKAPKPGWGNQAIWASRRGDEGVWGKPFDLGPPINTDAGEFYPSLTNDGTLYFTRAKSGSERTRIMRSRPAGGRFQEPEALPDAVNGRGTAYNACIAPDESYLIACVDGREDSLTPQRPNYYVFFRGPDDRWSEGINLGPAVNLHGAAATAPSLTRDGKHLFFGSTFARDFEYAAGPPTTRRLFDYYARPGNGDSDVYWIDASFIRNLKAKS
jgi:SAM-dependent methyltransferase